MINPEKKVEPPATLLPVSRTTISGLRWWMIALVFLATLINFLDRLTISVLAPVITTQLGLTNTQFAEISTWFLAAYAASQGFSGKIFDRIGTRRGYTIVVSLWSIVAMAHAFTQGLASLSGLRFLLGLAEGGNWPGAAKMIAEWFPVRQRALGMAIVNSGSAIGAVIAPPLIIWLQLTFGWRAAFLTTGLLGFGWLVLWHLFYESPQRHRAITRVELELLQEDQPATRPIGWLELLKYRGTWAIIVARFLVDPVWWLYIIWLPLYLYNVRGFSLKQIGLFAWVPYVAAGAGSLFGGWLSGCLIRRGWTVNKARKTVIVFGTVLMSSGIFAATAQNALVALALIAVVLFGFQSWISNVQTLPSDFFPKNAVASVAGLGGLGAGVGAMLFTLITGAVIDHFRSYTPILVAAALLPGLGTVVLFAIGGRIHRLSLDR
jgi:ACS family hexuronate transporter-like MFS transporter